MKSLNRTLVAKLAQAALFVAGTSVNAQVGIAVRELPIDFHPGDAVEVRLQVTPPPGATNWMVRERYPDGWDLITATNAASSNEFTGELVFGPFFNSTPRTLVYEVLSTPGRTNSVAFSGDVTINGARSSTTGTTGLTARNEWLFVGPQSLSSEYGISGTAFGAGRWVASSFGWITTIESGGRLTYPRGNRYFGEGWSRLARLGGLFFQFGTGDGPQMSVSEDGLAWKAAIAEAGSPPPFVHGGEVKAMSYGNGVWVAVGSSWFVGEQPAGAVFASTNGFSWKRVHRLDNPWRTVNAVAFASGKFVAVASYGTLISSTNGIDWTSERPLREVGDPDHGTTNSVWMNRHLLGICHGPAGWIVPTSVSSIVLRSSDGVLWNAVTANPGTSGSEFFQSFHADDRYWFSSHGNAYTTVDGSSWTRLGSSPAVQPAAVVSRAPDGVTPQYLAAGATFGSLVVSSNGTQWAMQVPSSQTYWPRYTSVASVGNDWLLSGAGCVRTDRNGPTDRPGRIWVPTFGSATVSVRDAAGRWREGAARIFSDVLSTTNGLLAAATARDGLTAGFLTGSDYHMNPSTGLPALTRPVAAQTYKSLPRASSWEYCNASLTKTADGYDLFMEAVSNIGLETRWGHFTSTNGSKWERRREGLNHATNYPGIRGLAWGVGRFVAVGEGRTPATSPANGFITSAHRIYTSVDGENYSPLAVGNLNLGEEGLTGVAFGGGRFVAIGNAGRILTSTNGLDWETARDSDGRRWNRVRYLDGVWGVVGNGSWVAFSVDGRSWRSRTAGAESDLTDIARQDGQFMLAGSHGMVLLSQPVIPAEIASGTLTNLPGTGVQFTVTGQPGRVLDIQATSNLVDWSPLESITNTTGTVVITDPQPAQARRFYRAIQQP